MVDQCISFNRGLITEHVDSPVVFRRFAVSEFPQISVGPECSCMAPKHFVFSDRLSATNLRSRCSYTHTSVNKQPKHKRHIRRTTSAFKTCEALFIWVLNNGCHNTEPCLGIFFAATLILGLYLCGLCTYIYTHTHTHTHKYNIIHTCSTCTHTHI